MNKFIAKIFFVLAFLTSVAHAQPQLVLLKHEDVVKRYRSGDDFVFRMKGSKTIQRTYVNNFSDTAVITHRDTVPFHKVDRLYFPQSTFYNTLGTVLVIGGSGIFLIDQFNIVVVKGLEPNLDQGVTRVTVAALALGLPMMLIKKKSQRLNHKYKLLTVKKGSPFFQSDPEGFVSPFIDN